MMAWHRWTLALLLAGAMVVNFNCGKDRPPNGEDKTTQPDGSAQSDVRTPPTPDDRRTPPPGDRRATPTDQDNTPGDRRDPPPERRTTTGLTYYKDIKAIVETKCLNCHKKGGIGPFHLEDFAAVSGVKALIKAEVSSGRMPPWGADPKCNQYSNDISLSADQKKKIIDWVDQGAVEGNPADYVKPPPAKSIELDRVDVTLKMTKPYTPKKTPDDHRCFVLDWPYKTTKYISGFGIKAGKLDMVHHVIAYLAHPKHAAGQRKKDPSGDGYYCPGVASGNAGINWLGVWAPGVPASIYPEGTGIKIEPGSKIVVQIHYNTTSVKPQGDQSSVQFKVVDSVKDRALMLPFMNYLSWPRKGGMKIPAGDADVKHSYSAPLSLLRLVISGLNSLKVYTAMLHMHQLASKGELYAIKDGAHQCLANVPRWNFNWQLQYNLKTPLELTANDSIGITCHYNNSKENQPLVDGKKRDPQDVYWGDGTFDEMCLGVLYVTCGGIQCPDLSNL